MISVNLSRIFGNQIRKLREERKISQQNLAEMCNFEKTNMARIEAGRTNPTLLTMYKISLALKIPLSELVDFEIKIDDDIERLS
ncbi:MAG: helix-turn-helix transcriptional regulator [Prolixibacteraceae bacterium]